MIKKLIVKNLHEHKKLELNFTDGVNVIIGDTGAGKTALIRALYLLFMNQPRNAEPLFQTQYDKKPLEIEVINNLENSIKRVNRKYYINNNPNPLKAFGSEVPTPVTEIFPFKDINWQEQDDPYFLISKSISSGNAAKILNKVTGMEDQELLIKEIKTQLSENNSNIKRLIKNNDEQQKILDNLKGITKLVFKAKQIQNLKQKTDDLSAQIIKLNKLLNDIALYKYDPTEYQILIRLLNDIKSIEQKQIKSKELKYNIDWLKNILNQLADTKKHIKNIEICNKLLHFLNSILSKQNSKIQIQKQKTKLESLLNQIKSSKDMYEKSNLIYNKLKKDFKNKLIEFGECPLCGTIFEGEKHIC